MFSLVENVVTDDFFNSKKSSQNGQKAEFGPSDFCRICASSFAIHLKIPKVFKNVVALVNYNERDTIV